MLNLKLIIGSTRPGRAADHVAPWITTEARDHGGARANGAPPPAIHRLHAITTTP